MKFISFNPWKKAIVKSIIENDNPMVAKYVEELNKCECDYFIGVTEPDLETPEHTFEELNIVLKDSIPFSMVPDILKKEIDNEELIEVFMEVY